MLSFSESKIMEPIYLSSLQCRTKKCNSLLGGHRTPGTTTENPVGQSDYYYIEI